MRTNGLIRLTHDPELREVTVGEEQRSVCTMRCAISSSRGRDAGFVDVVTWGGLSEQCAAHLTTGSAGYVDGHLRQEEWTDGNGERQQRHRIVAEDVQFLGRPKPGSGPIAVDGVEF